MIDFIVKSNMFEGGSCKGIEPRTFSLQRVRKTFKEVLIRRNEKVEANEMNVHNGHSS